jgi:hypothetical protein
MIYKLKLQTQLKDLDEPNVDFLTSAGFLHYHPKESLKTVCIA